MDIQALNHPIDTQTAAEALAEAASTAGYAPSIHDAQPWRWRLTGNTIDLHLERGRVPESSDPDGRLATLSCGAALHHARITMAAHGWRITVARMLQDGDRDLLARIQVHNRSPIDTASTMLLGSVPLRRSDDRPAAGGTSVSPEALTAITSAIEAEDTGLSTLRSDQLGQLAAAAGQAQRSEAADPAWQDDLAYWAGRPSSARQDNTAVFVMLHGGADEPLNWLRAGEALSAGWLTATRYDVSVLPHSAPIETAAMRAVIAGTGYPYLVLRLGPAGSHPSRTPRQPAAQIIERY